MCAIVYSFQEQTHEFRSVKYSVIIKRNSTTQQAERISYHGARRIQQIQFILA